MCLAPMFLCRSSVSSQYGSFLTHKQCAKEAEVEEVHVEENLETPTTKRNNVRVFKFNEKWKDGRPWLSAEDGKMFCSYCKEFDKTSRNKFISGCESMRIENVRSHEASNAHKTRHSAFLNSKKRRAAHHESSDYHGKAQHRPS